MIRPATEQDADAIATIEALVEPGAWSVDSVRRHLGTPAGRGHVLVEGGVVRAHLIATVVLDEAEILTIAVHPDARRRGLGRRLLLEVQDTWREAGVARAHLEVRRSNAAARALYASSDWSETGVRRGYYRDGEDAVLMGWSG